MTSNDSTGSVRSPLLKRFVASPASTRLALAGLTFAALVIRLWGISFGLPYAYHVDEHFYVPYAWAMGQGQLDLPDQAHGPSLYLATLLAAQRIAYATSGNGLSLAEFGARLDADPTPFLASARIVSALAGALTVPAVFALGRRYRGTQVGLASALLMAVMFFHVRDSHFGVPDSFMTLFVAAAGWLALRAYQTGRRFDFLLAGASAGLAAASKYTSAIAFVPVLLAAVAHSALRSPRTPFRIRVAACLAGLGLGFLIGYPNILINFPAFVKDISFLWIRVSAGFEGWRIPPDDSALFYLSTLGWGAGFAILGLSTIGIINGLVRREVDSLIVISFPITYFILMSLSRGHFGRYIIPVLPFLAVITAYTCLSVRLKWVQTERWRMAIGVMALLVVLVPNAANSMRLGWLLSQADTRTVAKQWIESHIDAGARIAVEWPYHTPPLSNGSGTTPGSRRDYQIELVWGFGLADHPIRYYRSNKTEYLVSTSFIYNIPVADEQQEEARRRFYARLPQAFKEIQTFSPRCDGGEPEFIFDQLYGPAVGLWDLCRAGPMLRIYQVVN